MKRIYTLIASCALVTAATASNALVVSTNGTASSTGAFAEILAAPPSDVNDDATTNSAIQAFNEKQSVLLAAALNVDGGTIAAGTRVASHMIFLNSKGNAAINHGLAGSPAVTFTFSTAILGVMSDSFGALEVASTGLLGAISTLYPVAPFKARGFEGNNVGTKTNDWYQFSGNTISLGMKVTEPGDWIRVITVAPVPVPGSLALLGTALVGAAALRRRKTTA